MRGTNKDIAIDYRHDLNSDVPLLNFDSMDYFRKEIARLEKLVAVKNGPSAAVSVVSGSGRASVGSSDLDGGYRLLVDCRNLIVGSRAMGRTKP